ncbi:hypothetical protein KEH56_36525 [Burkholderia cenocepacia]|uniref:hypothetical protein n=1 Tax=Burkholderia cenocepacia TaxID=95486 RepID=UPI001BAC10CE|nr:hypothetical protein [Burkholderia cenocepacia]QUN44678.1 hypothetical protein KEH56_36525 [Burkholderia cenocepacia]
MTNCLVTAPASVAVEPVFKSTDDALRFAFRFSTQQHCSSELASLLRRSGGASDRLVGPDGVVQAGMVRAEVDRLPPIQQALLIGRYALAEIPCTCGRTCCSGSVPNPEWTAAITTLTKSTIVEFSGRVTNFRLHREIIGNALLGIRVTDASLAARYGVHRQTVATHTAEDRRYARRHAPPERRVRPRVRAHRRTASGSRHGRRSDTRNRIERLTCAKKCRKYPVSTAPQLRPKPAQCGLCRF